jgi:glyoxylase-like metal-dependent hydrolase (beta-lactamase superfamily II)
VKKIEINSSIDIYQFPPPTDAVLGVNIVVLKSNNECIVFDAGYEHHMKELKPILDKMKIKYIICTHFHPDHCYGLNENKGHTVVGSKYAYDTLKIFNDHENEVLLPKIKVEDKMIINLGEHTVKLTINKGHSKCGLLINIDNQVLLTGDDIMFTNDGVSVLPYIADTIANHIDSLQTILRSYQNMIILPAHGKPISGNEVIKEEIVSRINYLEFVKEGNKDLEQFKKKYGINFESEKWHRVNVLRK